MELKSYLAFMRTSGLGAAGIRLRNRSWSNHVALLRCAEAELLTTRVYEAVAGDLAPVQKAKSALSWLAERMGKAPLKQKPSGFVHVRDLITACDVDRAEIRVFQLPWTLPHLEEAAWQWVISSEGKEYDYPGLAGFIPVPLPTGWATQSKRELEERLFCSEAAAIWCQLRAGVKRQPTGVFSVEYPGALVLQPWLEPYRVDPEWIMSPGHLKEITWLRPERA